MTVSAAEDAAVLRALELALNGPRGVNPQVGAVLLSPDGAVVAEGWHRGAGTKHAEVDALSKLPEGAARGLTAVVTLEPCNHSGRTGPCSEALIEAGIARVVYAVDDPNPEAGGGAERLAAAGVEVERGVHKAEGEELLASWLHTAELGRPTVTVKWAQSLDGRAAATDGTSKWITGPQARADVHARRAAADAIVVGVGTILSDDPALTARGAGGDLLAAQPQPVVIGRAETPEDAAVRSHPKTPLFYDTHNLTAVLADLRERGIQSVFVEGGPTLASAFLRAGLVDELLIYVAPVLLGGDRLAIGDIGIGTIGEACRLAVSSLDRLGDDFLIVATPRPVPESPGAV